jgi:site-specific DNA-methyltransferase (adenine-specific)
MGSKQNLLFYGDNLDVLRRHFETESVDLIYLDPPFQSGRDYNVFYSEPKGGKKAAAQIKAFEDTWEWDESASAAYDELIRTGLPVAQALESFRRFIDQSRMLAYMSMMAIRLLELRRVLKPTGSIFLHCDPTASHYLKVVLDAIFSPERFINEIIWQRTVPKSLMKRRYPNNHDILLAYAKGPSFTWNEAAVFRPYDLEELDEKTAKKYSKRDKDGRRYQLTSLLNPNQNRPNLTYEFMGVTRVWRWTKARMQKAHDEGLVVQSKPGATPRFKRYLDEQRGKPITDVWTDIPPVNSQAAERLGYPTQKPLALLERIIRTFSKEGQVVLDPFCGCGTTIEAAQQAGRRWMGIDITHLAIGLIRARLQEVFGEDVHASCTVVGEPQDLEGARQLAEDDRFQFERWALGLVGARSDDKARGPDKGIDGTLTFFESSAAGMQRILFSVKSGKNKLSEVRDLRGVLEREGAAIAVLIALRAPTRQMRSEAASAGFYRSLLSPNEKFPRVQIITVEELLVGKRIAAPPSAQRKGPKRSVRRQQEFLFDEKNESG